MPEQSMRSDHRSRFSSVGRIVLALTLLCAPLPFAAVQDWAWPTITFLTLLILLCWAIASIQNERLRIALSPVFLPVVLMLVLGVLQLTLHLTLTPFATRNSLLKLATDVILLFVVVQLFANARPETWRRCGVAVLTFGFIFSFLSILQFLWNPIRIIYLGHDLASPFGPYVDRDHYAVLMEIVIPLAAAYVISRPKRDTLKGILWFAVLVPAVSLLLTGSRGGFISALAEVLILGWVVVRHNPVSGNRVQIATMGIVLVAAAGVFLWLVPPYFLGRIGTVKNYIPGKNGESRPTVWRNSLEILRDKPLFGTGMGSFVSVFPMHQSLPSDLVTEHAHNDYVEALAETGAAGGILIIAMLIIFLSIVFRKLGPSLRYEERWIQLGAAVGCCGILVHSFVDFGLQMPANAAWFVFSAGLALLSGRVFSRPSAGGGSSRFADLT